MPWKDKSVLVTGGKGFIGGYLIEALVEAGASVTALYNSNNKKQNGAVRWVKGDITDPASIKDIFTDIDTVFHLAAISNVPKAVKTPTLALNTNTNGTINVLEGSRLSDVKKFVYVSTAHVYGVPQYLPVDESHPIVPREPYAASKIASEMIVKAYGNAYRIEFAIIRPFNVFGPGQDVSFLIPGVIEQALRDHVIKVGNIEPTRDFLYVRDCVDGFLAIGDRGRDVYNIGSGREVRIADVIVKIRDMIDTSIPIVSDDDRKRSGDVEIPRMCANVSRLAELGWEPHVGFEEGLARTVREDKERMLARR
jgi:nucleoside-diphosphate-sugar epimerase